MAMGGGVVRFRAKASQRRYELSESSPLCSLLALLGLGPSRLESPACGRGGRRHSNFMHDRI